MPHELDGTERLNAAAGMVAEMMSAAEQDAAQRMFEKSNPAPIATLRKSNVVSLDDQFNGDKRTISAVQKAMSDSREFIKLVIRDWAHDGDKPTEQSVAQWFRWVGFDVPGAREEARQALHGVRAEWKEYDGVSQNHAMAAV